MSGSSQATEGTSYRVWIASLVVLRRLWDEIGEPEVALDELTTFVLKLDQSGHRPSKTLLSWEFTTSLAKLLTKVMYRGHEMTSVKNLLDQAKYEAKSETLVLLRNLTRLPSYPEATTCPEAIVDSVDVERFVEPKVCDLDEEDEVMDDFVELKNFLSDYSAKREAIIEKATCESKKERVRSVFKAIENLNQIVP